MGSIERKLKRKNKGSTKKDAEKALATKIASFGKLPDNCLTCELAFDKTDKEMVRLAHFFLQGRDFQRVNGEILAWWTFDTAVEDFRVDFTGYADKTGGTKLKGSYFCPASKEFRGSSV